MYNISCLLKRSFYLARQMFIKPITYWCMCARRGKTSVYIWLCDLKARLIEARRLQKREVDSGTGPTGLRSASALCEKRGIGQRCKTNLILHLNIWRIYLKVYCFIVYLQRILTNTNFKNFKIVFNFRYPIEKHPFKSVWYICYAGCRKY